MFIYRPKTTQKVKRPANFSKKCIINSLRIQNDTKTETTSLTTDEKKETLVSQTSVTSKTKRRSIDVIK